MAEAATAGGGSGAGGLIGTLYVRLTAQDDMSKKVEDTEKKVVKSTDKMGKAAMNLKGILTGLGVAFGLREIVGFVKDVIQGADELKKFSLELDISIDKLAGLKFAADKANIGEQFQQGMRKFAESMREAQVEGTSMQALFRDVLKIDPTQGMDAAFEQVVDNFSKWENGINKMGVAQELFGTRNARFVNLLNQGTSGIRKDVEELARVMGISYEEAAEKANQFSDAQTTLKAAATGLALTFLNEALPAITGFTGNLAEHLPLLRDYAKIIGTGVVFAVKTAVTAFKGFMGALKVVAIGILAIPEAIMKFSRWLAEKLTVAFEFWANAAIKSINFVLGAINSMTDRMPDWIKKRLGISGGTAIQPLELFHLGKPSGLDDWIDVISDARKDLQDQLSADFGETAQVIKEGNETVKEALKGGPGPAAPGTAPNIEAFKAHNEAMKKFMDQSKGERHNLRMDIAGIGGIEGMSEATRMEEEKRVIEEQLTEIQRLRDDHFAITAEQEARMTEMEALYAEKRRAIQMAEMKMRLNVAGQMFGDLAEITKAWAGEQSGIYKAMFAVSKAFAIAEATVKIAQGIAAAAANPWPLNLFAMASVVAATASIVSSIQAVQLEFGGAREKGGPVSPDKAFLVGERGPEMFVPNGRGSIVPNNRLGGGPAKIIVNNYTDAKPEVIERDEGGERVIELVVKRVKGELNSDVQDGRGFAKTLEKTFNLRRGRG